MKYFFLHIIALPLQLWFLFKTKPTDNVYLRCFIKTFPIILQAIFLILQATTKAETYLFYGLLASAFADVALEYSGDFLYFVSGIIGFILAHVMNFIGLTSTASFEWNIASICAIAIIIIIWILMTLRILSFKLDKIMTIACIIYASFILSGFYSACHLLLFATQFDTNWRILCFIGYISFVCSDFTLFHNVFGERTNLKTFICMFTYYLAQEFLSIGIVLCIHDSGMTSFGEIHVEI